MPVPEHHNEIYHRYMGAAGETFYEDLSHVHNGLNNFLTNLLCHLMLLTHIFQDVLILVDLN